MDDDSDAAARLLEAAEGGDVKRVARALASKALNIDDIDMEDNTALMWAARNGHVGIVHMLVDAGANVHCQNELGETALSLAVRYGGLFEIVDALLLARGDPVNLALACEILTSATLWRSDCSRHLAARKAHYQDLICTLLYAKRCDRDVSTKRAKPDFGRPLRLAIDAGNVWLVEKLLAAGADANQVDNDDDDMDKSPPLVLAASKGNVEIVRALLKEGADINKISMHGDSALLMASIEGFTPVLKLLLTSSKINVDLTDALDCTALMYAASNGHADVVHMLLGAGANAHYQSRYCGTALTIASAHGHIEIVELLLARDISADLSTAGGWTALLFAAMRGSSSIVEVLLSTDKVNANHQNIEGDSALLLAAQGGYTGTVDVLLAHGADVGHVGRGAKTALQAAAERGHNNCAALLISAGVDDYSTTAYTTYSL